MDPFAKIKGGDTVKALLENRLVNQGKIEIVFLSNFKVSNYPTFWRAIDVLLVPSIADNSPNVIQEARLAGLPIIARFVGGVSELIDNRFDMGFSYDEELFHNFYAKILDLVEAARDSKVRQLITLSAKQRNELSLKNHISLYESMLI
jgi:glycosyltransferase involved in cell wall biosynthesis